MVVADQENVRALACRQEALARQAATIRTEFAVEIPDVVAADVRIRAEEGSLQALDGHALSTHDGKTLSAFRRRGVDSPTLARVPHRTGLPPPRMPAGSRRATRTST